MRRLLKAALFALAGLAHLPAAAQYAVDPGEAVAAATLVVRTAPVAGSAKAMEIEAGRTVTVLGYPRGTGMAWIAIGGRELGYVDAAGLAPVDRPRPVLYRAAVVAASRAAPDGVLPGDQLNPAGDMVAVAAVHDGKVTLHGAPARREVKADDLVPVIGTYPAGGMAPGTATFFAARLGRFASVAEAEAYWSGVQQSLPELAGLTPYIYRRVTAAGAGMELAAGPFDRTRVEEVCVLMARRGQDCWVVSVDVR